MCRFHCVYELLVCIWLFCYTFLLFSFLLSINQNNFFYNYRRKQDQSVSFVTKDWRICLDVFVKEMRGCLWQNICPMKHWRNTFSIVRDTFFNPPSIENLISANLWFMVLLFLCFFVRLMLYFVGATYLVHKPPNF